ncbi:MAG: hypothetical protein ABIQ31_23800 [Ferruginibacter sp.]
MIKNIIGVIVGYAIFVISALALFKVSKHDPHADPTIIFAILTAVYGAVFSFIGGFAAQLVAGTANLKINYILAFIIAGFATFSFFKTAGNHWTQVLAIFIFAPMSIFGGLVYRRRKQN